MAQDQTVIERAETAFREGDALAAERLLAESAASPGCAARLRDFLVTQGRMAEALALAGRHEGPIHRALEAHASGDFPRAAALCEQRLAEAPDDPVALLHHARAIHNLGRVEEALRTLDRLTSVAPGFAEGWYARAHALRAAGELAGAIEAYEQALRASPGLTAARFNLGLTCLNADRPESALACFEALMAVDPDDVEALIHAALARQMLGQTERARDLFERALGLAPEHAEAHRLLGALLNETGDARAAAEHLRHALAARPDDPDLHADLADVHELSSDLGAMGELIDRGLSLAPGHPRLRIARARLERRQGESARAAVTLRGIDPNGLPPRMAMQFFHELGLALDRLGEADGAMRAFDTANRISAGNPRARAIDGEVFFSRVEAIGTWLANRRASDAPGDERQAQGRDLCFLIGFPRSGTTLIDTIVDAHDGVASIEERPTLEPVIEGLARSPDGYPAALDALGSTDLEALRDAYRKQVSRWIGDAAPDLIVDKLPLRMLDVPLIRRLFPAARLLFVQRHPCDVVLSNFMQLYEPTPAFVNCQTLAGTVRFYDAVMSLWPMLEREAGASLHTVRYEDLVDDPERELAAVCRHLGVEWDRGMLDPQRRLRDRGRVRTTSYQQVGESIYSRAAGRWNRYRKHLDPHLERLAPHAHRMGYRIDGD
jgi:tetratricopeptide (TPR) repeat protein